ncbi:MAG: tryptophan synthase subunit alpha [Deltaproteobacteria bacterium]|nr:tryptophan synthase subunit alpha [Deltaproteobacteria bacterium]
MKTTTTQKHRTRVETAFERLKEKGEKALITFITAGDPDLGTTKELIFTLEKSGADIIELGIPFSDPAADGPTIQLSSERAVKKGVHLSDVIGLVREVRETSEVPIVLFGYYNPIFSFGLKKFAKSARAAGADGVLIVDLPPEEADDLKTELDRVGMDLIFLLTPTSDEGRMRLVSGKASGFIYFVSVTGVTGARTELSARLPSFVKKVRRFTDVPVGVGFGISTPEQAKEVSAYSDGVIVGSAIINIIAKNAGSRDLLKKVGSFVSALKGAINPG